MSTRPSTKPRPQTRADQSRLLPLLVAVVCCFVVAILLGFVWSLLFGTPRAETQGQAVLLKATPTPASDQTQTPEIESTPSPSATPKQEATPAPSRMLAPAGEVSVPGGVATLGGEGTDHPLRRETVEPFVIGETEVTNEQYLQFLKETGHKPPEWWKGTEYPPATQNDPVVGVTWQDAVDYCEWLSKKIGATVRLPSEKEWVLTASGVDNFKYPWGNEWNPRAANYTDTLVGIRPVKSYPENRSPFGAYDMAGNVWEWVSDDALDANGKPRETQGVKHKVVKGGSAGSPRESLTTRERADLPLNRADAFVGFRYVVIR